MLESLFNKLAGLKAFLRTLTLKNICERLLSASQVFFNDFHQKRSTTIFRTLFNVFISFIVVKS